MNTKFWCPGCDELHMVSEFLSDCTHGLAGQIVALPELPEWCKS